MRRVRHIVMALIFGCIVAMIAGMPALAQVLPPALEPWKSWVLYDHEDQLCPMPFNGAGTLQRRWMSRLSVTVQDSSGMFTGAFVQDVVVCAPVWVPLPGDADLWPESVRQAQTLLPVSLSDQGPAIWCQPGTYRIHGVFNWGEKLPEWLPIPPETGIVSLIVAGKKILMPEIYDSRLRLRENTASAHQEDAQTITVFRLIADDIPLQITTRALLQVSGRSRDIRLPDLLPPGGVLLSIDSPLPARLADDGALVVQAMAGQWDVRVTTRMPGPLTRLPVGKSRYGDETWSFKAFQDLRMVNVSGAPSIEPSRTEMPDEWKGFPAFHMQPDSALTLDVIRRGDPDPAPDQLALDRTWWLDFDGGGFTLRDRVTGTLSRTWHLSMASPMELGRVAVDGEDQLITRQGEDGVPGVQLRQGKLVLEADSRLSRFSARLPAVGWDHDFQKVTATLNLPPGWRLFSASGVDTPRGAWLQAWSLMDFFLVLIIAISVYKLRSPMAGLLALLTLVLIFHEPGAPKTIWLHLLAVIVLLRYLPAGKFRTLVRVWGVGAGVVLAVIVLPFILQEVRGAIYPQLSRSGIDAGYARRGISLPVFGPAAQYAQLEADDAATLPAAEPPSATLAKSRLDAMDAKSLPVWGQTRLGAEQNALIQTGPGLPAWKWRTVSLRWNGPVDQHQEIRLWLIPPTGNRILGLARVVLLILLIGVMLDIRQWRRLLPPVSAGSAGAAAVLLVFLLMPTGSARSESQAAGFPPQPLLDELQARLLKPPACVPACADISRLELIARPERIELVLSAHAQTDTAIPLPSPPEHWRPTELLMDGKPVQTLTRDLRGHLWMALPEGVHEIRMAGPTGTVSDLHIGLPMLPRRGSYTSQGWQVLGFRPDGGVAAAVSLARTNTDDAAALPSSTIRIPPWFEVTRTLRLGLQWEVITHIRRVTRIGEPAMLSIPLLPGAAVTTPGIETKNGAAQVVLEPDTRQAVFSATLPVTSRIELNAPAGVPWTETWILDAATVWQFAASGITAVHHQDDGQNWRPQWQPWPGETVTLEVTRPEAIAGQTLTLDSAVLDVTPGERSSRSVLTLSIRTSKGGRHTVQLPETATLQDVTRNGKILPVRQEGRNLDIPLDPGAQTVAIQWLQNNPSHFRFAGPAVHIGGKAVNATVTFRMPDHRWILFAGGPQVGPAVLFWSYVLFVVIIAAGLGRIRLTPLRTRHWMLLGLGLTQVPAFFAVIVAGWFLAMGYRAQKTGPARPVVFNLMQVFLVALTLVAAAVLYVAVSEGLLGVPDMQIAGNGSSRWYLNWTCDRIDGLMPMPWVISLPLWSFHVVMLFWSLWLAFGFISWIRWGWRCFFAHGAWKKMVWQRREADTTPDDVPPEAEKQG
ncbi:hypothetical protein LJC47_01160 [Desulfosarcina sp. OttesenSCG-928-B08]|nr:hypothetical protein [Desulfosarcina sp. OttesenSCG-928-B08]